MAKLKTASTIAAQKPSSPRLTPADVPTSPPVCNLRPLGNKVIVWRDVPVTTTEAGLHVVEQAREVPRRGTVLALGPEVKSARLLLGHSDNALAVGDRVYFNAYAGSDLKVDGQTLLILVEEDVLAVETIRKEA